VFVSYPIVCECVLHSPVMCECTSFCTLIVLVRSSIPIKRMSIKRCQSFEV